MAPMVQLPRPTSCKVEGGGPIFIATRQFLTPPPMATHRSLLRSPKEWSHDHEVPGIGRRLSSPGCSVIHMDESHGSQSQSVDIRGLILSASSGSTDKTHWYIGALRKFPMGGPTAKGGKCGPSDGHQVSPSLPESTLHESDVLSQSAVGRLWARLHNCMLGNQEALGIKLRQHVNSSWLWSPISFLSTFFRAVGQPMHVNNIFSGLVIFSSLCYFTPPAAVNGSVSFLVSQITAQCMLWSSNSDLSSNHQHFSYMDQGLMATPAFMLGTFMARDLADMAQAAHSPILHGDSYESGVSQTPEGLVWQNLWATLGFAVLSTFLQTAVVNHLERSNLPPLHLTFNIMALIAHVRNVERTPVPRPTGSVFPQGKNHKDPSFTSAFSSWPSSPFRTQNGSTSAIYEGGLSLNETEVEGSFQLGVEILSKLINNGLQGSSQIYHLENAYFGAIVLFATLFFSPWTFIDMILGGVLVQVFALAMDVAITPNLVSNGILSFVAINFFLLLSIWTKLAGLLATAFVVVLCQGWNGIEAHARGHCNSILEPGTQDSALISQELVWPALSPSGPQPPFSTWPFTLVTFVFLLCASTRSPLRKIDIALLSYPEMHRRLFRGGTSVDDEGNMFAT